MVPIFHLWLHLEDVFNWFSIYTLLFTFSQARILHLHSTQSVDIFSILPISHLWSRLHLENVRNWCRTCIVLHCRWINCTALQCEQIQNSKTQTIILKILFWFFGLMNPFPARVQNLLASRQRGGMKSREVKQSREIKQSQTKQRSQTKSNKAHPRKNLESSANGQGNVGCRRCTSILHLIQLWICLCLYFYISICI